MPTRRKKGRDALTLDLEGPKITAVRFRRAVDSFFALVEEVTRQVAGKGAQVDWIVTVRKGSIHLNAAPEAKKPDMATKVPQIARAVKNGINLVGRRPERPRYFSDEALRRVRELATVTDAAHVADRRPTVRQVDAAGVTLDNKAARVTRRTVEHVNALLGSIVEDYGTLEGRLVVLSAQSGFSVSVIDPLTNRGVRCLIKEELLERAIEAFRKRIAVTGRIHYRRDGEPNVIEVDELYVFPDRSKLPSADAIHGIMSQPE